VSLAQHVALTSFFGLGAIYDLLICAELSGFKISLGRQSDIGVL
jgi:hypothetical protein